MRRTLQKSVRAAGASLLLLVGVAPVANWLLLPANALAITLNAATGIRTPTSLCFWDQIEWNDMNAAEKQAWTVLGWSASTWDRGNAPAQSEDWVDLSASQKAAARALGFDDVTWDNHDANAC